MYRPVSHGTLVFVGHLDIQIACEEVILTGIQIVGFAVYQGWSSASNRFEVQATGGAGVGKS